MSQASTVLANPSVERVRSALARAGLRPEIVELPGAARTAQAAASFLGCEVGQIANSLVFRAQSTDGAILVMSSGARRVDTGRLSALLGEPAGKADAEFVRSRTGFAIGGVPPLGHDTELPTIVDESLRRFDRVWCAAGTPHAVFETDVERLIAALGGAEIRPV